MTDGRCKQGSRTRSGRSPCRNRGLPSPDAEPNSLASRADWRRLRHQALQERARRLAERYAFLESGLEPGEQLVARSRNHPFVTDRRILDGRQLLFAPRRGEWVLDEVPFDEITGSLGEEHDQRPILRLEHRARGEDRTRPRAEVPLVHVGRRRRAGEQDDADLGMVRDPPGRNARPADGRLGRIPPRVGRNGLDPVRVVESDPRSLPRGARVARPHRQLADPGHPRVVRVAVTRPASDRRGRARMDRRPPVGCGIATGLGAAHPHEVITPDQDQRHRR